MHTRLDKVNFTREIWKRVLHHHRNLRLKMISNALARAVYSEK